jgi:hypothetical protein
MTIAMTAAPEVLADSVLFENSLEEVIRMMNCAVCILLKSR